MFLPVYWNGPQSIQLPYACAMPANLRPQNNYCREMFYEWTRKLSGLLTLCYAKQCNMGNFYSPRHPVASSFSPGLSPAISPHFTLSPQGERVYKTEFLATVYGPRYAPKAQKQCNRNFDVCRPTELCQIQFQHSKLETPNCQSIDHFESFIVFNKSTGICILTRGKGLFNWVNVQEFSNLI